jgi:hypothetical protein
VISNKLKTEKRYAVSQVLLFHILHSKSEECILIATKLDSSPLQCKTNTESSSSFVSRTGSFYTSAVKPTVVGVVQLPRLCENLDTSASRSNGCQSVVNYVGDQARIHHRGCRGCIPHRLNQKILQPLNYGRRAQTGRPSAS